MISFQKLQAQFFAVNKKNLKEIIRSLLTSQQFSEFFYCLKWKFPEFRTNSRNLPVRHFSFKTEQIRRRFVCLIYREVISVVFACFDLTNYVGHPQKKLKWLTFISWPRFYTQAQRSKFNIFFPLVMTRIMMNRTFINVTRQNFTLHLNVHENVAKRCYDDLIRAYYEGLTVLIKDFSVCSFPAALWAISAAEIEICLVKCFNKLEQLI